MQTGRRLYVYLILAIVYNAGGTAVFLYTLYLCILLASTLSALGPSLVDIKIIMAVDPYSRYFSEAERAHYKPFIV